MIRLPLGTYAVLLCCALPCFLAVVLAPAWLRRVLAGALGGSGGGPGYRVPVRVRRYVRGLLAAVEIAAARER
jgi:hypothetical protein